MARPPWQAERQSRPPGKPRPIQVAAKCGVCIVALLGFVVLATTFVARLASIRILPATQFAEDLIRGSLAEVNPFPFHCAPPTPPSQARQNYHGNGAHSKTYSCHQIARVVNKCQRSDRNATAERTFCPQGNPCKYGCKRCAHEGRDQHI